MDEARSRQLWDHTANLLAVLANGLLKAEGGRGFVPADFHPFHARAAGPDIRLNKSESVKQLWKTFGKRGVRRGG